MPMEIIEKETEKKKISPSSSPAGVFFNFGVDGDHPCGSPKKISAASDRHSCLTHEANKEDVSADGFEFAFAIEGPESNPPITSSDGQNRPVYPVFGRSLLAVDDVAERTMEEEPTGTLKPLQELLSEERKEATPNSRTASSSDSSEADELEGIPAANYCVWTPPEASSASALPASSPPVRWKKSTSTGSLLWWRIRDLIMRSHSDGKEKLVFLAVPEKKKAIEKPDVKAEKKAKDAKRPAKNASKANKMDMVTAHRMFYSHAVQSKAGAPRRSFLPYRQDLIGLFAICRTHYPL